MTDSKIVSYTKSVISYHLLDWKDIHFRSRKYIESWTAHIAIFQVILPRKTLTFYAKNIANTEHPKLKISYALHVEMFQTVSQCFSTYIRAVHSNTDSTGCARAGLLLTDGKCAGNVDLKLTLVWKVNQ